MKVLAKVLEGIGLTAVMLGGAGMDNASIVIPMILAFTGIAVMFVGYQIDEVIA